MGSPPREVTGDPAALQSRIDAAEAFEVIDFDHRAIHTIDTPLRVNKPVTVRRLRLALPPELARTPLLVVDAEGATVTDSYFRGNGDTVGQKVRASLLEIRRGRFRVERCVFENAAKNGVTVDPGDSGIPLVSGVVRDIVGRRVIRDVVSLSGGPRREDAGEPEAGEPPIAVVRDVFVENVHAEDSPLRGAVEVSDGSWDITVRGVTAVRCVYAVDVQDHNEPGEINRNILLEAIRARNCRHAVRTANAAHGHSGLTIRHVVAEDCDLPLRITHTSDVLLDDIRIVGAERDPQYSNETRSLIFVKDCTRVAIRDVVIRNVNDISSAIRVQDSLDVRLQGLSIADAPTIEHPFLQVWRRSPPTGAKDIAEVRGINWDAAREGSSPAAFAIEGPRGLEYRKVDQLRD